MYDLLIIGSGPAGISAALSAKARNLDFLWFGSRMLSPKITKAERVMNYPGLPTVTGPEMRDAFLRQIDGLGIEVREERVNSIYDMGGYYTAVVNDKMYDGRTVILAAGVSNSREIPGESRLLGKGLSYCATCDGAFFRGKDVAVVGGGDVAVEDAIFLSRICEKADLAAEVFLCTSYKDCGIRRDNLRHTVGYPAEILGEDRASGLVCGGETVEADGIFCLRSCVAPAALLPGLKAENGHIQVDRQQRADTSGWTGDSGPTCRAVLPPGTARDGPISTQKPWARATWPCTARWNI